MIINIFGFKFRLVKPFTLIKEELEELVLYLPDQVNLPPVKYPVNYQYKVYDENCNDQILKLFDESGFHFSHHTLQDILSYCVPGGVHLIEDVLTGEIVAIMMSRHLSCSEFPFGGRIDWLATSTTHRGKGLGTLAAILATKHLINLGYKNIWVTTQSIRPFAIKIFTSVGYIPTKKTEQQCVWKSLMRKLDVK